MTTREMAGLIVLNVFYIGVGAGVLWAIRGWRSWGELGRLVGVAYLLGIASLAIVLTAELVLGISFDLSTVLITGSVLAAVGIAIGRARGRSFPRLAPLGWRVPRLSLPVALLSALMVVYFESLFRASRVAPVSEWDAWWVWTIRAKALYFFGNLGGDELVRGATSDYPSYPPALPLMQASAFEAMGSADPVTLHLQHWFLALGFVAALIGLLVGSVRPVILLSLTLIAVAMPVFLEWATYLYADLFLAFQVAAAASLVCLWLEDRSTWKLMGATILLGGALLTKREAVVVVACLICAFLVASLRDRRWAWPRLGASAGFALALSLPWWLGRTEGTGGPAPSEGFLGLLEREERILPALELAGWVFVDLDLSLGLTALAGTAVLVGLAAGARKLASATLVFMALSVLAVTALIASEPLFEFSRDPAVSPVERLVVVYLLTLTPLIALLLGDAHNRIARPQVAADLPARSVGRWRLVVPWAVVGLLVLGYPVSALAGHTV